MNERLTFGELIFEVRRSERRRTVSVAVGRKGELCVYAPSSYPLDELEKWTRARRLWVYQKLSLKEQFIAPRTPLEFVQGESICYLGKNYRLRFVDQQKVLLLLEGEYFFMRRDVQSKARILFRKWYRTVGSGWVDLRVSYFSSRIGVSPDKVSVRDIGNRWGSCSRKGSIAFHWKVLQLPVELIDYIIVHELIHLKFINHGKDFWNAVERALPDWKQRRDKLAVEGLNYLRIE